MKILKIILIALAGIVALLLLVALFIKKEYDAQNEIIINAPRQKVYDYLKTLKNQDSFNKWVMADPNMKREYTGTDGTVGFVYSWNGNKKAGEGELELKTLVEGERIETEIRFVRPMKSIAYSITQLDSVSENQTKITWNSKGDMPYPMNIMMPMVQSMLAKDMGISLQNLKAILEK
ncbi:MAG: polyketide cyclase [Bacteroidetes bacterium B1(2017)]|nr:MAG: polyketide cyclase [Bacteroidetes bacterium B1(2017)]